MPKAISKEHLSSVSMGRSGGSYRWTDWDMEPDFIEVPADGQPTPGRAPAPDSFAPAWDANPKFPARDALPSIGIPNEWAEQAWVEADGD